MKKSIVLLNICFLFIVSAISFPNSASAGDAAPILSSQSYSANIPNIGNIWKSNIPTSISFPSDKPYVALEFPIEGILPYKTLSDRATGVEVDFELWTTGGAKISSRSIYSSSWNPAGPNTLVTMTLFKNDLFGDLVMVVSTQYRVSTNGLLTRYLSTETKIPLTVQGIAIPDKKSSGIKVESSEDYTGNISSVGNIWQGKIPTRISFPIGTGFENINFSIQGLLPYSSLADKATGVEVEFELWNSQGKRVANETVYSFDWNPVGPNTFVSMRLSESDAIGNHTLIIRTIYEISTTGLLTRYLKQEDKKQITVISRKKEQSIRFNQLSDISMDKGSFNISSSDLSSSELSLTPQIRSSTPGICDVKDRSVTLISPGTCTLIASQPGNDSVSPAAEVSISFKILQGKPKTPSSFSGSREGNSIQYLIGGIYDLNTKFDVSVSPILNPNLNPVNLSNFYGPSVWKTVTSQSFTITPDEINAYYNSIVIPYSKYDSIFLVRVRATNDMGTSDWGNGIYTFVKDMGIVAPSTVTFSPSPETPKTTITCVKGKLIKKVTAVNPKCPAGYKKK